MSDTPRLDALETELEIHIEDSNKETVAYYQLAYELERELNETRRKLSKLRNRAQMAFANPDIIYYLYDTGYCEAAKFIESLKEEGV